MKAKIFINRQIVNSNKRKTKETGILHDEPAISVNTYKGSIYTKEVKFGNGARLVQDAENPICSGATIWIETDSEKIEIID